MMQHGIPRNPLYDMGARRVGCFPCIFSAKNELRGLVQYRPETIEAIQKQEASVNPIKGISTFFGKGYVPERFCTKRITAKDGSYHMVPTINDVAAWAMTGKRARGPMLDFDAGDINPVCQIGGHCE
jgi:3'-phosphoadenosine 5'-phosphosulfate sulfotransferase (PAPS reductase)/FAD synthetase